MARPPRRRRTAPRFAYRRRNRPVGGRPVVVATSLAQLLGIAIKNAIRLLDGFVVLGIASEVTHRSKRRLYGLTHLAPLRAAAAPPRRPQPGCQPGRPGGAVIEPVDAAAGEPPLLVPSPPLPPRERRQCDFSDIDQLLDLTDQAIRRAQNMLEQYGKHTIPKE